MAIATGSKLAELGVGESFGEEALISKPSAMPPSRCSPTACSCGSAGRTSSDLLARAAAALGGSPTPGARPAAAAKWLDVRLPSESETFHLNDALERAASLFRPRSRSATRYAVHRRLRHRPAQFGGRVPAVRTGIRRLLPAERDGAATSWGRSSERAKGADHLCPPCVR